MSSRDMPSSPAAELRRLTVRTHAASVSEGAVLINPALIPFAKPGALLQIIPWADVENESLAACDRCIFHLGEGSEKDFVAKYGNLELSVVTEVAKAFKLTTGNQVTVALVPCSQSLYMCSFAGK